MNEGTLLSVYWFLMAPMPLCAVAWRLQHKTNTIHKTNTMSCSSGFSRPILGSANRIRYDLCGGRRGHRYGNRCRHNRLRGGLSTGMNSF